MNYYYKNDTLYLFIKDWIIKITFYELKIPTKIKDIAILKG